MDFNQLKQELLEYGAEVNIQKIGFASADTFDTLKQPIISSTIARLSVRI